MWALEHGNFGYYKMKQTGDVAHMVERSLCMREVRGSIPRISKGLFYYFVLFGKGLYIFGTGPAQPKAHKLLNPRLPPLFLDLNKNNPYFFRSIYFILFLLISVDLVN